MENLIQQIREEFRLKKQRMVEYFDKEQLQIETAVKSQSNIKSDTSFESDLIAMYDLYIDSPFVCEHSLRRIARFDNEQWLPTSAEYVQFKLTGVVDWEHSAEFSLQNCEPIQIHCDLKI